MPPAILKQFEPLVQSCCRIGGFLNFPNVDWLTRACLWMRISDSLSLSLVIGRIEILGGPQEVITVAPHFQSSKHSKSAAKRSLSHIIRVLYRRLCRCWACWVNHSSTPTAVSGAVLLRHLRMVGTAGEDTHWVHELGVLSPVDNHRPAPAPLGSCGKNNGWVLVVEFDIAEQKRTKRSKRSTQAAVQEWTCFQWPKTPPHWPHDSFTK